MKKYLVSLIAIFTGSIVLLAAPARPITQLISLSDGTTISALSKGDESLRYMQSPDGRKWIADDQGLYHPLSVEEFKIRSAKKIMQKAQNPMPNHSVGNRRGLIILVEFQDVRFCTKNTREDFENIANKEGYNGNGNTGSVKDYFRDASYGKLNFEFDVYGTYVLSKDRAAYGGNSRGSDKDPRSMVREAVDLATKDGCDLSVYDADNDGLVDGLHIIYAGVGEEAYPNVLDAIWAHAWVVEPPYLSQEKKISYYSCSSEISDLKQDSAMSNVAVLVHEMSHLLGILDYYDTDYEDAGMSVSLEEFDVMDMGMWNDDGKNPPLHNVWSRQFFRWSHPVELTRPQEIMLLSAEKDTNAYYFTTSTEGERFWLENRGKSKWDQYLPASGLIIYHADENNSGWTDYENCINCRPSKRGFYIKQADGGNASVSAMGPGTAFPGIRKKTAFADSTSPNSYSWAGVPTGKSLTNIRELEDTIFFSFMEGMPLPIESYKFMIQASSFGKIEADTNAILLSNPVMLDSGTQIKMKAIADSGYRLQKWFDNDTNIERIWILDEDVFVYALFEKIPVDTTPDTIFISREKLLLETAIAIYPNPVKNQVSISSPSVIQQVELYDMRGIIRFQTCSKSNEVRINMEALPKGMYILRIRLSQGVSTHRIVKL